MKINRTYSYITFGALIVILLLIKLTLHTGKENIQKLMEKTMEECILTDFHRRNNMQTQSLNNPLNRKMKKIHIMGKDGEETIELADSLEEYIADQLILQYLLAQLQPLVPDDFNRLFQEELNKAGITCRTGIVYTQDKETQYSGQDSTSYRKAILTPPVTLDIKNTLSIQAWADCSWTTLLRQADVWPAGCIALFLATLAGACLYYKNKKEKSKEVIQPLPKDIRIDPLKKSIYINGKECPTSNMGYEILSLLINEMGQVVTREQIIQKLWPQEKQIEKKTLYNRINIHIKTLRETLNSFPEYRIDTISGKGYKLSRSASEQDISYQPVQETTGL